MIASQSALTPSNHLLDSMIDLRLENQADILKKWKYIHVHVHPSILREKIKTKLNKIKAFSVLLVLITKFRAAPVISSLETETFCDTQCMIFSYKIVNNKLLNDLQSLFQCYVAMHDIETRKQNQAHVFPNWWRNGAWCRITGSVYAFPTYMMISSNGNKIRVTGLLRGEFTGHRWIPLTKASDGEL